MSICPAPQLQPLPTAVSLGPRCGGRARGPHGSGVQKPGHHPILLRGASGRLESHMHFFGGRCPCGRSALPTDARPAPRATCSEGSRGPPRMARLPCLPRGRQPCESVQRGRGLGRGRPGGGMGPRAPGGRHRLPQPPRFSCYLPWIPRVSTLSFPKSPLIWKSASRIILKLSTVAPHWFTGFPCWHWASEACVSQQPRKPQAWGQRSPVATFGEGRGQDQGEGVRCPPAHGLQGSLSGVRTVWSVLNGPTGVFQPQG